MNDHHGLGFIGATSHNSGTSAKDGAFRRRKSLALLTLLVLVPGVPSAEAKEFATIAASSSQTEYIFEHCQEIPSLGPLDSAELALDPANSLAHYLAKRDRRLARRNESKADLSTIRSAVNNLVVVEATSHGKLIPRTFKTGRPYFMYEPTSGYAGVDRAVFTAELEGERYKVVLTLKVYAVPSIPATDSYSSSCAPSKLDRVAKSSRY